MIKTIIAGLGLAVMLVPSFASASAASNSRQAAGCCGASCCPASCCTPACCDASCFAGAHGELSMAANGAKASLAKSGLHGKKQAGCCSMPCCNGGCCTSTAKKV